jgi:hypothetical protein
MSHSLTNRNMQYDFGITLAEGHLEASFDKYIVWGFSLDKGFKLLTNCDDEQFNLILEVFQEEIKKRLGE